MAFICAARNTSFSRTGNVAASPKRENVISAVDSTSTVTVRLLRWWLDPGWPVRHSEIKSRSLRSTGSWIISSFRGRHRAIATKDRWLSIERELSDDKFNGVIEGTESVIARMCLKTEDGCRITPFLVNK